eukprot:scaffold2431_cov130-Amphora_coffeaeformis.AAC.2
MDPATPTSSCMCLRFAKHLNPRQSGIARAKGRARINRKMLPGLRKWHVGSTSIITHCFRADIHRSPFTWQILSRVPLYHCRRRVDDCRLLSFFETGTVDSMVGDVVHVEKIKR